jgi:uncharacterized membrane protein
MSDMTPKSGSGMRLWLRIVLVLSLALNLAVIGFVAGNQMKWGGKDRHHGPKISRMGGPLTHALSHEDRHEIGRAMRAKYKEDDAARTAQRATWDALIVALEADVFDRAVIAGHLADQRTMMTDRMAHGQTLLLDRLEQMSPEERRAYVERLKAKRNKWRERK